MANTKTKSEFIEYLKEFAALEDETDQLPSLSVLSEELNVSVARLREQLEVAKSLGFVDVRPRTGIKRLEYSFFPAIWQSISYAIELDPDNFDLWSKLRINIETAYWQDAAKTLTEKEHKALKKVLKKAWKKLRANPPMIPHTEHRKLHLLLYRKLGNPFVLGILEAYWEAYEAIGLNIFTDYEYLETVWNYHERMVNAVCEGNFDEGEQALIEHFELLYHRPE